MEEYPQSNSYQIEASMESNNDSQTTQYPQSNSYQNKSGKESNPLPSLCVKDHHFDKSRVFSKKMFKIALIY